METFFSQADNLVSIIDVDNSTVVLSHRLTPYNTPPFEKGVPLKFVLTEALLVGNVQDQVRSATAISSEKSSYLKVKCTELSIDMFWMLQALEREPHEELLMQQSGNVLMNMSISSDSSPAPGGRAPYVSDFL